MATVDEAIAQVVLVTNTSPEKAAQYVTLADGDPDQAVTLFFENDGADLAGALPTTSQTHTTTSHRPEAGNPQNPINLDDDNVSDDNDPEITGFGRTGRSAQAMDDDEAMARRLQEEMYGGSGQDEDIRAPIARQSETLLGPGADMGPPSGMTAAVQQQMYDIQRRTRGSHNPGIFSQRATSTIWNGDDASERDVLAQATGGASEESARANTLAKLFQPPWDLMFQQPWAEAREEGREQKKWLLVNVQDGSVFACQVLNRDMWKNPGVVDTVKENFVFIQYDKDDIRADQYLQYYFQESDNSDLYPHIAIIDPRTGERMKLWSSAIPQPAEFLMQLHEFLDRYSLDNAARNPVAKRKSEASTKKSVDQMTEEEMMEMALQQSIASQSNELKVHNAEDPDDLTRSIGDMRKSKNDQTEHSKGDAMSIYENGNDDAEVTPFSLIRSDRPYVEPATSTPNTTRIQLKHPGGREIRKFALTDPVRRIYEILKAEPFDGKAGVEFELVSMGKNLMESVDSTIDQAGLKNSVVMIEFLDG